MILVSQKRVLMGLSFTLLFAPVIPTKAHDSSTNNSVLVAGLVGAGIVGFCGLIYGIVQGWGKSPEWVVKDAQEAFDMAHMYGHRSFYTEYMNTFEQACYGEPSLDHIERNFLEPVARKAHEPHIHVHIAEHIRAVQSSLSSLEKSLKEVKGALKSLQSRNKTSLYDRLIKLERDIEAELVYLTAYHQRFSEHQAYFILAQFVFELFEKYQHEFTVSTQYRAGEYAEQYLRIAKMRNVSSDYPVVHYHAVLCSHITALNCYIRDLKYQYTRNVPITARRLREYLTEICDFIANTSAFKEERERKNEDDARREMLALRKREAEAKEAKARAEKQRALAAQQQARAAQQQARAQQTVVVVQQQVVQQAPATQQPPATNQNAGTNSNSQITIGQGNDTRTVSVEWYEQNKPGAVDAYVAS